MHKGASSLSSEQTQLECRWILHKVKRKKKSHKGMTFCSVIRKMQGTNKIENNTSFHFSNELNHCGTLRQGNIQIGRKETEGREVVFTPRLDN